MEGPIAMLLLMTSYPRFGQQEANNLGFAVDEPPKGMNHKKDEPQKG